MSHSEEVPEGELLATPAGIGIVAPHDLALDRELWRWVPESVSLYITRLPYGGARIESIGDVENLARTAPIADACRSLVSASPTTVAYLCTSGSFIGGLRGEQGIKAAMEDVVGQPSLTTSGALLEALEVLGVGSVAIGSPYTPAVHASLADFLGQAGLKVEGSAHLGMTSGVSRLAPSTVTALARAASRPAETDAVFLSCTNLPTERVVADLERELGIPVLSANQVTMWAALRRTSGPWPDRKERLFGLR